MGTWSAGYVSGEMKVSCSDRPKLEDKKVVSTHCFPENGANRFMVTGGD